MTPRLKIGDRVKYRSIGGNVVVAEVIKLNETQFITRAITIDDAPPKSVVGTPSHQLKDWGIGGFQLLRHRIRIIDHESHYASEQVEIWK